MGPNDEPTTRGFLYRSSSFLHPSMMDSSDGVQNSHGTHTSMDMPKALGKLRLPQKTESAAEGLALQKSSAANNPTHYISSVDDSCR
jgi:hypothetical protein